MSSSPSAAYVMGRTEHERRRLQLQGAILKPASERFLKAAGIGPGMRVLDLGCGAGDMALLAAHLSGESGDVVGVDLDEAALAVARGRAADAGCRHLSFECSGWGEYAPGPVFDAVIARHVLIHNPDPAALIRKAAGFIRPGGIVAFQEYDLSFWPEPYPSLPLTGAVTRTIVRLFRALTPNANIGMRLFPLLREAGLSAPRATAECLIDGGPESPFYEWLAETTRSLLPALQERGMTAEIGEIETLGVRIAAEITEAGGCLTTPLVIGAFATAPADAAADRSGDADDRAIVPRAHA